VSGGDRGAGFAAAWPATPGVLRPPTSPLVAAAAGRTPTSSGARQVEDGRTLDAGVHLRGVRPSGGSGGRTGRVGRVVIPVQAPQLRRQPCGPGRGLTRARLRLRTMELADEPEGIGRFWLAFQLGQGTQQQPKRQGTPGGKRRRARRSRRKAGIHPQTSTAVVEDVIRVRGRRPAQTLRPTSTLTIFRATGGLGWCSPASVARLARCSLGLFDTILR